MPEDTAAPSPNVEAALAFLREWPATFVHLTHIAVDPATGEKGRIESRAFSGGDLDSGVVEQWLRERAASGSTYFSVNSLITPIDRKASKTDVREMVALHADIDLPEGTEQVAGTEALLARVGSLKWEPTLVIASGGGVQCFWVLRPDARIAVKGDSAAIEAAEAYNKTVEAECARVFEGVGKVDHCFNIDRIMRLVGTINVPDQKKRERGRVARLATVAANSGKTYAPSDFGATLPTTTTASGVPAASNRRQPAEANIDWDEARAIFVDKKFTREKLAVVLHGDPETLASLLHGDNLHRLHEEHTKLGCRVAQGPYGSFSDVTMAVARGLARSRTELTNEDLAAILGDQGLPGNRHVTRQKDDKARQRAISRAIAKARTDVQGGIRRAAATAAGVPIWRDTEDPAGLIPTSNMRNAMIAVVALGVECRLNLFKHRVEMSYQGTTAELRPLVGEHTDDATGAIREVIDERWGVDFGDKNVHDAVMSIARRNSYDPVLDYIDRCEAEHGGHALLDSWMVDLLGAEDTELNREIGRCVLVASVRRARHPGEKFDMITVLEGIEGLEKSGLIELLYGKEYFNDQHILGMDDKTVMEQLEGRWGYECADLTGMSRAEVESVKAFASRTTDRGRRAYGRTTEEVKRRCVLWGTTNDDHYLLSQTGNRRFLPVAVPHAIDLDAVAAVRDQLWGEAAIAERDLARYPLGKMVNIPRHLWAAAGVEQEARRIKDPWEDVIESMQRFVTTRDADGRQQVRVIHHAPTTPDADESPSATSATERVASQVVLEHVLRVPIGQQTQFHYTRLATVMDKVGWRRPKKGTLRIGDRSVRGYWRPATEDAATYAAPPPRGEEPQDDIPF